MTATQYIRAFVRFWWIIGFCAIVGVVLPIVVVSHTPRNYVSSINVLVTGTPTTQASAADASLATTLAVQRVPTYSDIARSPVLAERVLMDLDTDISAAQLSERTTAVVQANSTVLKISIKDTQADRARLLASRAAKEMVAIIDRLEREQAQSSAILEAKVVGDASAPAVSTPAWRNPSLGGAAGLLVGLALAVGISRLDPRLRDPDIVAGQVGAPVLGLVPRSRRSRRPRNHPDRSRYDDAVQEVRTGIFFLRKDTDRCLTVAITSPSPVAGASRITGSIAEALAATGARVLVVEADFAGTDVTGNSLQHDQASGVDFVPAVSASGPGTDLLHGKGFASLLEEASERYDYVLVNAPATSVGTDASAVAARCRVTVLVMQSDTRERQLREGLRHLRGVHAEVGGVVLLT